MRTSVDISTWVAGWTALVTVVLYGVLVVSSVIRTSRARQSLPIRILVTGSRGKSGTVRLLHAVLKGWQPSYAKITGTVARELLPEGTEREIVRVGSATSSEMPRSIRRAAQSGASVGIFECMAITPALIRMVQESHVQARYVVIPTIRLDHMEEEGFTEWEIGTNIMNAIDGCEVVFSGVDQPELEKYFREYCRERGIEFVLARPDKSTPICAGHHPTNVALALAVARHLGVDPKVAASGLESVSFEPMATEFYRITNDGMALDLFDLGGANDPQSAWEAIRQTGFDHSPVIPILVNRWERPLRSVSFFASFRGSAPLIGVAGTLPRWVASRHKNLTYHESRDHLSSQFFSVTPRLAKDPQALMGVIGETLSLSEGRVILLLLENTHDTAAELLRHSFALLGEKRSVMEEVAGK